MQKLSKAAIKVMSLLRKAPKVTFQRTAGLAQALAANATKGSKTYKPTNPFKF